MSKTYLNQVEKVKSMVDGLRTNFDMVKNLGITHEQLDKMARLSAEAEALNGEVEDLRRQVSEKVHEANDKLTKLKEIWLPVKNRVKSSFDPLKWEKLGIPDKR